MNLEDAERFNAHVLKGPTPDACWLWMGAMMGTAGSGPGPPSPSAATWRRISRAERSARSRHLREQLKVHGWDQDLIRQMVHDIDRTHPTLF